MFEPIRGGTRGGQAEFKWSDVSADKDRENYLGHSINAPTGRWQKNKDVHWYNRDLQQTPDERAEEIRNIKEAEAEALSIALGFGPSKESSSSTQGTGTNAIPIPSSVATSVHVDPDEATRAAEKAERRRRRAERREEKAARKIQNAALKEQRRAHNARRHGDSPPRSRTPVPRHRDSSSPSPKQHRSYDIPDRDNPQDGRYRRTRDHHSPDGDRFRDRSRSPYRRDSQRYSQLPPRRSSPYNNRYDGDERESERFRDRQRWDRNTRQETHGGGSSGRK